MSNTTRFSALTSLAICTFALCACETGPDSIERRQAARTSGAEARQDRYDARFEGRQDRREMRSDRADARYDRW